MRAVSPALWIAAGLALAACGEAPAALAPTPAGTGPRIVWDLDARPFPEIPFPNDVATRPDPGSPTGRRLNVSLIAPTLLEGDVRAEVDRLAGFSTLAPISIRFDAPLDVVDLLARHGRDLDPADDAVYVIDMESGELVLLDLGDGAYPLTLERPWRYFPQDPRADGSNLLFETVAEDLDGDGQLDPGEDTDGDRVLDHPNTLTPEGDPADELLTFYERETNTLLLRPLSPLRPERTYAVVLTRRLCGVDGQPVRSPFAGVNHTDQTEALARLREALPGLGLDLADVAFAWHFTTQSTTRDLEQLRMGLHGEGPLAWLAERFPPEVRLEVAWDDPDLLDHDPFVLPMDELRTAVRLFAEGLFGQGALADALLASFENIDYLVLARAKTPVLIHGLEAGWRLDADAGEAEVTAEDLPFLVTIPKARPELGIGPPYPVAIYAHGTGGSRMESLGFAGHLARLGIATVGIELVMHGLVLQPDEIEFYRMLFHTYNLGGFIDRLVDNRAVDVNADGWPDPAGNFWSFHTFRTRDTVRQGALDVVRLVQVLRSFDGQRRWSQDLDGDGHGELEGLAGDFDGDGRVDLAGPDGPYFLFGISLGAIVSSLAGPVEPSFVAVAPIAPGGGLSDVAVRSLQQGVPELVLLPMVGPLLIGEPVEGGTQLLFYLPSSFNEVEVPVAALPALAPGQRLRLENLDNGERAEAQVNAAGGFRFAVACDRGDRLRVRLLTEGGEPTGEDVVTFDREVSWEGAVYPAGSALRALAAGHGALRQTPELRRFVQVAQTALDPGDPANYAAYYQDRELYRDHPGVHRPKALALVLSAGDMNVPISTGLTLARAAGLVGYLPGDEDPRYGRTAHRVLVDGFVAEGLERLRRFTGPPWNDPREILLDVDDLSEGLDGFDAPRLEPPLRLGRALDDGRRAVLRILYPSPRGAHGIMPSNPDHAYDIDLHAILAVARFFQSAGREWVDDTCLGDGSCTWLP